MPDIPADAISAAEQAIDAAMTDPEFRVERSPAGLARAALEAAAPVLAEAVAQPRKPEKASAKITEDEAVKVPCTTCGTEAGEPCDFGYYKLRLLSLVLADPPRVHTARYQLGVRFADARGRRKARDGH